MIIKVKDKTQDQLLNWNTRIEVASRILIIFGSITLLLMSYFVAAGCAKILNQFYDLIGEQPHAKFKSNYIMGGIISLCVALIISFFVVIPYIFMKKPEKIKQYIIISTIFLIVYVVGCYAIMISFVKSYNYTNPFITASYIVLCVGLIIVCSSKFFLWREVTKQWKMRKTFEYLNEEKQFKEKEEKQFNLINEHDQLIKQAVEKEDLDQHVIDNVNKLNGPVIKKKHLSKKWRKQARNKESNN